MDFLYAENKYGIRVRPTQTKYNQEGMICAVDLCYQKQSYSRLKKLINIIAIEMHSTNTLKVEDYIIELTGYFLPCSPFCHGAVSLFTFEFGRNKRKNGIRVADILVYRLLDAIHPFYEQINNYDDGSNQYVENYCYILVSLIELTVQISYLDLSYTEILKTYFWTKTLPKYSMFWNCDGELVKHYILFNVCLREKVLQITLDCSQRIPSKHICFSQFKVIWKQNNCLKKRFKQSEMQKANASNKTLNTIKSSVCCEKPLKTLAMDQIHKELLDCDLCIFLSNITFKTNAIV